MFENMLNLNDFCKRNGSRSGHTKRVAWSPIHIVWYPASIVAATGCFLRDHLFLRISWYCQFYKLSKNFRRVLYFMFNSVLQTEWTLWENIGSETRWKSVGRWNSRVRWIFAKFILLSRRRCVFLNDPVAYIPILQDLCLIPEWLCEFLNHS